MKNTARTIDQVVNGSQGRFVSVLVSRGLNRTAYSAKVKSVTSGYVYFTDTNNGKRNRRITRESVLRVACGKAVFARSAL